MRLETFSDKALFFTGAFTAWSLLFHFVNIHVDLPAKLGKKKVDDIKNRIISIVHGLFALFVSGYHIYRDRPSYTDPSTPIQHIILLTTGAYFLYDFLACCYYGLVDMALVVHHSLCVVGVFFCEYTNNSTAALIGLALAECSNFPMHFRAILRTIKMRYTKLYELSETMYMVTYILARGVVLTYIIATFITIPEVPIAARVCCLGLWGQSLYFVYEMQSIMGRKWKQYKERCKKGISYNWLGEDKRITELSYYKNEGGEKVF
jgi:hypothetical protein